MHWMHLIGCLLIYQLSNIIFAQYTQPPQKLVSIPECPRSAKVMNDTNGRPRKCLPRHSEICGADACCFFNQIDYFCCEGVNNCPTYSNVTVVIYRGLVRDSPTDRLFAEAPRANVPNFDQYPGVRATPAPAIPTDSIVPAPAYQSIPTPAPASAPAPSVGYGGGGIQPPQKSTELCPTCMGQSALPQPGQQFIAIQPSNSGSMQFVMPQNTGGSGQGGFGQVAPQPAPSYGGGPPPQPGYGGGGQLRPQPGTGSLCPTCNSNNNGGSGQVSPVQPPPNSLCPTCNNNISPPIAPQPQAGYGVPAQPQPSYNPAPQPSSGYSGVSNPVPVAPQPQGGYGGSQVQPQPGYGGGGPPQLPPQPGTGSLCPTCNNNNNNGGQISPVVQPVQPQNNSNSICPTCNNNVNPPIAPQLQTGYGVPSQPQLSYYQGNLVQQQPSYGGSAAIQPPTGYGGAPSIISPTTGTTSNTQPNLLCPTCGNVQTPPPVVPTSQLNANGYGGGPSIVPPPPPPPQGGYGNQAPAPSSYSQPAPQPSSGYGAPSGSTGVVQPNLMKMLCPTCSMTAPVGGMPFIAVQMPDVGAPMQFVMPVAGQLCPTCAVQPPTGGQVISSYPVPGLPSPAKPQPLYGSPAIPSNSYSSGPSPSPAYGQTAPAPAPAPAYGQPVPPNGCTGKQVKSPGYAGGGGCTLSGGDGTNTSDSGPSSPEEPPIQNGTLPNEPGPLEPGPEAPNSPDESGASPLPAPGPFDINNATSPALPAGIGFPPSKFLKLAIEAAAASQDDADVLRDNPELVRNGDDTRKIGARRRRLGSSSMLNLERRN